MVTSHIVASLEGLDEKLQGLKSDRVKELYAQNAWGMSYQELRDSVDRMKAKGRKFIPAESCKHVNPDGSCGCAAYAEQKKNKKTPWKK